MNFKDTAAVSCKNIDHRNKAKKRLCLVYGKDQYTLINTKM
jgi:hypothetical protein